MIIAKVRTQKWKDKKDALLITVPQSSGLRHGDYVRLTKIVDEKAH